MDKPIVVNLIAAPGTGKSTIAAGVFEELKWRGVNAELITEFAKDKVWEENPAPFKDGSQLYLLGKQFYRMNRCRGGADVLITDSPIYLNSFYLRQCKDHQVLTDFASFDRVVYDVANSFTNMNYFLNRKKKYNPKGRLQTEEESDQIAKDLYAFFTEGKDCQYTLNMLTLDGTKEAIEKIVNDVMAQLPEEPEEAEPEEDDTDENYQFAIARFKEMCMEYNLSHCDFTKHKTKEVFGEYWPISVCSELSIALCKFFGMGFPVTDINKCNTMRELIEYIKEVQSLSNSKRLLLS